MTRGQILNMQAAINDRLRARGRRTIAADGVYGPETREAVHLVKYLLGFPVSSLDSGPSLWFRQLVQHPALRPPTYLARARSRAERLARPKAVSPRAAAVRFAQSYAGNTVEDPPGSNRGGVITSWQRALGDWLIGTAWCGTFCAACLRAAGVQGTNWRMASVANIEDDAKGARAPFRGWTTNPGTVQRGDLVVLFGRGVHVELVVSVDAKAGLVHTVGGNTSSGNAGSQNNGGGVYARTRPLSNVHGFALVDYPG